MAHACSAVPRPCRSLSLIPKALDRHSAGQSVQRTALQKRPQTQRARGARSGCRPQLRRRPRRRLGRRRGPAVEGPARPPGPRAAGRVGHLHGPAPARGDEVRQSMCWPSAGGHRGPRRDVFERLTTIGAGTPPPAWTLSLPPPSSPSNAFAMGRPARGDPISKSQADKPPGPPPPPALDPRTSVTQPGPTQANKQTLVMNA